MKFLKIALLVASVKAAEGDECTDDTIADVCTDEASCCGYKVDETEVTRVCSGESEATPSDIEAPVTFSCANPEGDEAAEGAFMVKIGASALILGMMNYI